MTAKNTSPDSQAAAAARTSFDGDGYVALPGFLAPAEVSELTREVDRYVRDVVPRLPVEDVFYEQKADLVEQGKL